MHHVSDVTYIVYLSQETHVIHTFKEDFYGQILSVAIAGYIRPERGFAALGKTNCTYNYLSGDTLHTNKPVNFIKCLSYR